jgi:hypothetical protein
VPKRSIRAIAIMVALACGLAVPRPAAAQVGLALGTEYGFGGVVRIGDQRAQIEAGGGVLPLLFVAQVTQFNGYTISTDNIFKVYFPATVGSKLVVRLSADDSENPVSLKLGASYNSLLATGVGGGVEFQVDDRPATRISLGAMIFPDAKDRLRTRVERDQQQQYSDFSAPLATFQVFASLAMIFR